MDMDLGTSPETPVRAGTVQRGRLFALLPGLLLSHFVDVTLFLRPPSPLAPQDQYYVDGCVLLHAQVFYSVMAGVQFLICLAFHWAIWKYKDFGNSQGMAKAL